MIVSVCEGADAISRHPHAIVAINSDSIGACGVQRRRWRDVVVDEGRSSSVYQGKLCPRRRWYRYSPQPLLAVNRRSVRAAEGAAQLDDDLTTVWICGDLPIGGIQFI